MGLRVLTAANSKALVTLQRVKDRLGITGSGSDALLNQIIAEVSSAFVGELGRELIRQRYEETIAGNSRSRLFLTCWPVDEDSVTLTIDATAETDFVTEGPEAGILYRESGWTEGATAMGEESEGNVVVTYKGGWIAPDDLATWDGTTAYALRDWVKPTDAALSPLLFECTTAGNSGASEPTWPAAGATVTDGTAVFTGREARELPTAIQGLALFAVFDAYQKRLRDPGTSHITAEGFSQSWSPGSVSSFLPDAVRAGLNNWRYASP